jgi:hypothetical protein
MAMVEDDLPLLFPVRHEEGQDAGRRLTLPCCWEGLAVIKAQG